MSNTVFPLSKKQTIVNSSILRRQGELKLTIIYFRCAKVDYARPWMLISILERYEGKLKSIMYALNAPTKNYSGLAVYIFRSQACSREFTEK